jgi:hypothetical protein
MSGGAGNRGVAVTGDGSDTRVYLSIDSGATWTALPAPPAPTSQNVPLYYNAVVSPSGAVLIQPNFGASALILDTSAATAVWTVYAPAYAPGQSEDPGAWQVEARPGGARLWTLEFDYGGPSALAYLPLP